MSEPLGSSQEVQRFPCPCCGYLTIGEPGTYEICRVCFWEDDDIQSADEECAVGANSVSLKQARENYKSFGAMEKRFLQNVRKPLPVEIPDAQG